MSLHRITVVIHVRRIYITDLPSCTCPADEVKVVARSGSIAPSRSKLGHDFVQYKELAEAPYTTAIW